MIRTMIVTTALAALTACAPCEPPRRTDATLLWLVEAPDGTPPPQEGLYARFGFDTPGRAMTRGDLAGLAHGAIITGFPAGAAEQRFEGPRLSALLAHAGAPGAGARLTALDGYQVEIPPEMIAAHAPILAHTRDGQPLAIGGYGPLMLIWPRGEDPALAEMNDDLWVWGVFALEILPLAD